MARVWASISVDCDFLKHLYIIAVIPIPRTTTAAIEISPIAKSSILDEDDDDDDVSVPDPPMLVGAAVGCSAILSV